MTVPDEPVRGHVPPPWYYALDGIERIRAFSRGLLPQPPLARLLGLRTTNVATGTATLVMPASPVCTGLNDQAIIAPLLTSALKFTAETSVGPGFKTVSLRFSRDQFRPTWNRPGNFIARGQVVNSSHLYVFTEVQAYDADGRHVSQGALHSAVVRVDPPPPSPPKVMEPVSNPVYDTPDPYLRKMTLRSLAEQMETQPYIELVREEVAKENTNGHIWSYGLKMKHIDDGRLTLTMPASEWFCTFDRNVSNQVIGTLAELSFGGAGYTLHQPGKTVVNFENVVRFLRPVAADGRRLRAESVATEIAPERFQIDTRILDADDQLIATGSGSCARIDNALRSRRRRKESKRVLATLLFTDIVDSTKLAEELGDAAWQALLEKHQHTVRQQVSRFNGTEVDTAGDGFFARFESPAHAIEAARSVRHASDALDVRIRAGIHSGECELVGNTLAGMAVHIAARIQALAEPGEILVSSTVKDLTGGSSIQYESRGEKELKGVPDPWRVFAVTE